MVNKGGEEEEEDVEALGMAMRGDIMVVTRYEELLPLEEAAMVVVTTVTNGTLSRTEILMMKSEQEELEEGQQEVAAAMTE